MNCFVDGDKRSAMEFTKGTGFGRCAAVISNEFPDQSNQRVGKAALSQELSFCPPMQVAKYMHKDDRVNDLGRLMLQPPPPPPPGLGGYSDATSMPSRGSFGHPLYCGAPCKYAGRSKGCRDARSCLSCHLCKWTRKTHGLRGHERLAQESLEQYSLSCSDSNSTASFGQDRLKQCPSVSDSNTTARSRDWSNIQDEPYAGFDVMLNSEPAWITGLASDDFSAPIRVAKTLRNPARDSFFASDDDDVSRSNLGSILEHFPMSCGSDQDGSFNGAEFNLNQVLSC
jgi:hypothetical protein